MVRSEITFLHYASSFNFENIVFLISITGFEAESFPVKNAVPL